MSKITVKQLEALSTTDDTRTLREPGGLIGRVRSGKFGVTVLFRYECKLDRRKRDFALGSWPKKALAEIRAERDRLRVTVADGIDPIAAAKAARIEAQQAIEATIAEAQREHTDNLTVNDLFDTWIVEGVARRNENAELLRKFPKDVLPTLGHIKLRDLTDGDIRTVLRKLVSRGVVRTAISTFDDITQMLSWGEKRQPWRRLLIDGNPAVLVDMEALTPDDYEEERTRVISNVELLELHTIFMHMEKEFNEAPNKRIAVRPLPRKAQLALWICLGSLSRIGELLQAKWKHIDFEAGTWFIPKENVKGTRRGRKEHTIFMSDFVHRQFTELKGITGETEWCFPARNKRREGLHICLKTVSKSVGDRQVQFKNRRVLSGRRNDNTLVLAAGQNGEWTPHDLRRTGATIMQALGVSLDVIDRCQNHVLAGPSVRRPYLLYNYHKEMLHAWKILGERLDAVLADNTDIVELNAAHVIVD